MEYCHAPCGLLSKPMAVFTPVTESELKEFLLSYDIGTLLSFEGIEQGVSNTNYFITTDQGRFVLTLFEPRRVLAGDIRFFLNYAAHLQKKGIPCPLRLPRRDGADFGYLCGRPADLFTVLEGTGATVDILNPAMCEKAGALLAQTHIIAQDIKETSPNHFGLERWRGWVSAMDEAMDKVAPGLRALTTKELEWISSRWPSSLPAGPIHGDYFPDNVFFKDGNITGLIDFHFVCTGFYVYDLAIACNAWAFDEKNEFRSDRMDGLIHGYKSVRALTGAEEEFLPVLLRAASLRFLLSRIEEKLNWKPDDFMIPHDPIVFEKRLKHFQGMSA